MSTSKEKHTFTGRLKQALTRSSKKIGLAAELAPQFNLRTTGEPISTRTTRKWLVGTTMPTLDKIEALAAWLGVPLQWLHLGIPESAGKHRKRRAKAGDVSALTVYEAELIARLRVMPEVRYKLIVGLAEQLSLDGKMWTG